jgi:hypothetical protein
MGEGTNRVDEPGEPSADELAERVGRSRERLDTLVAELDQRRHVLGRLEETFGRHKVWVVAAGVLVLGAIGAAVQLTLRHRRKQRTLRARAGRISEAFGRMFRKPERVARSQPNVANKVLAAAATSLTSMVVKRAGARALPDKNRR